MVAKLADYDATTVPQFPLLESCRRLPRFVRLAIWFVDRFLEFVAHAPILPLLERGEVTTLRPPSLGARFADRPVECAGVSLGQRCEKKSTGTLAVSQFQRDEAASE